MKGIRDKSFYVKDLLTDMVAGYNQIANGVGILSLTDEDIKKVQEDTKGVLDLVLNKVAESGSV